MFQRKKRTTIRIPKKVFEFENNVIDFNETKPNNIKFVYSGATDSVVMSEGFEITMSEPEVLTTSHQNEEQAAVTVTSTESVSIPNGH